MSQNRTGIGLVFVAGAGQVAALDRATGAEVWRTKLKGATFVNLLSGNGELYATAYGEIFALDPATGTVLWTNPLKGMGYGLIAMASGSGQQGLIAFEQEQQEAAGAAATTAIIT